MEKGFKCQYCFSSVPVNLYIGTTHRNHCPHCLWSKHVDLKVSGDRKSTCLGAMEPVGLTFKEEGQDKYGKKRQGELMLVHHCQKCNRYSINRLASDDDPKMILELFEKSKILPEKIKSEIKAEDIQLLKEEDLEEIKRQLFGKTGAAEH